MKPAAVLLWSIHVYYIGLKLYEKIKMILELPTELIVMVVERLPLRDQLRLRLCCKRLNSIIKGMRVVSSAFHQARANMIASSLRGVSIEMHNYYRKYGGLENRHKYPIFLVDDEILVDYPFRLSCCEGFLEYLATTALSHEDDRVYTLALEIAINLTAEPKNSLGCRILKNRRVVNRLIQNIENCDCHDQDAAHLLGNCHDHRSHTKGCTFSRKTIPCSDYPDVLARCKAAVNLFHKNHPRCDTGRYAADMWNACAPTKTAFIQQHSG